MRQENAKLVAVQEVVVQREFSTMQTESQLNIVPIGSIKKVSSRRFLLQHIHVYDGSLEGSSLVC